MYKILIIDDQWRRGRAITYNSVLSTHFNVVAVEFGKDLFLMLQEERDIDLYLVDIVLDGWKDSLNNNTSLDLLTVLRKIGKEKPIILVSNEFENLVKADLLTELMNNIIAEGFNNIVSFILWKTFEKESLPNQDPDSLYPISEKIKLEILKNKKYQLTKEESEASIGIIAALEEELMPFLEKCNKENVSEERVHNYTINKGIIIDKAGNEIKFVAAKQERMGMVDAAYLASTMVNKYKIKYLFMIGVCGGRSSQDIKIGDIIIPLESVAYQQGKLTNKGFLPRTGTALTNSCLKQSLTSSYTTSLIRRLYDEYDAHYKDKHKKPFGLSLPSVKYDEMACGDIIVNKTAEINRIAKRSAKEKLCSVDMESYSILRACNLFPTKISGAVIKSVMDDTSISKNDDYKEYAAFMAAGFLYNILKDNKHLNDAH